MKMTETAVIVPFVTVGSDDKVMPLGADDVPPGVYRAAWGEMTPPAGRTEASEAPTRRMRRPTMRVRVPAALVVRHETDRMTWRESRERTAVAMVASASFRTSLGSPAPRSESLAMVAVAALAGTVMGLMVGVVLLL